MSDERLADYLGHMRQAATINLDVVWGTVQTALPALLKQLQDVVSKGT